MAVIVLSLQFGLPRLSCFLSHDPQHAERMWNGLSDERSFWCLRFSFDRFLNPRPIDAMLRYANEEVSAAVCRDEIVVLAKPNSPTSRIERINLLTGRVTSSPTPVDVVSVSSDGQQLSWIDPHSYWGRLFFWKGRPVRFQRKGVQNSDPQRLTYELMEQVDGRWQPANHFVLLPNTIRAADFTVEAVTGKLCCFARSGAEDQVWFRYDLPVYQDEELDQALATFVAFEAKAMNGKGHLLSQMGWWSMPPTEWIAPWDLRWVEQQAVSKLGENHYPSIGEPPGRAWTRFFDDGRIEHQFVTIPVRERAAGFDGPFHLVTSADGTIYFISRSTFDKRWTVVRWDNGRFHTVVDQFSPLLGMTCLDAFSFALLALIIPTMVLWWLSSFIQARFPLSNEMGDQVALASMTRRGLARAIDITAWGLPLLLAFVLHPEVVEWWSDLFGSDGPWENLRTHTVQVVGHPTWDNLIGLRRHLFTTFKAYFPLPVLRPLALLSLAIFIVQTAWQCVSGQTLGKWLVGIRVVRSDLRHCSWGRSCLREVLFFVDTLLLLSWVPGVISILLTSKSQRIGDWVTDTVVVRSASSE